MFTRFDTNKSTKGASKLRRDLINAEVTNLRDLLPLPQSTRQRLSQLQLMALVCVYVRKANYFQQVFKRHDVSLHQAPTPNIGFSKALSGFLMMLTQNGKLLYISDNAAEYLGHSMEDLLIHGDSVYDIIDKQDHGAIQAELGRSVPPQQGGVHAAHHGSSPAALEGERRMFLCRMNVSRNARRQMRFGDQKVVLVQGHYLSYLPLCSRNEPVFLATCTPIAMPETRECVVQGATNVFTTIHSMDMKIVHVDKNGEFHLGYSRTELQGVSWYQLLHWDSTREAQSKHRLITQSEQDRSCILLVQMQCRTGDFVWVHVVLQVRDSQDASQQPVIVCTNQVLSDPEATVMLANAWLYHYYSVQSKIQFGIQYEGPPPSATSATGSASAMSPRLSSGAGSAGTYYHSPTASSSLPSPSYTHPYMTGHPGHMPTYGYHSPGLGLGAAHHAGSPGLVGGSGGHHQTHHHQHHHHNNNNNNSSSSNNNHHSNNGHNNGQNNGNGGDYRPYAYRIDAVQPVDYSSGNPPGSTTGGVEPRCSSTNSIGSNSAGSAGGGGSGAGGGVGGGGQQQQQQTHKPQQPQQHPMRTASPPPSKRRAIARLEPLFIPADTVDIAHHHLSTTTTTTTTSNGHSSGDEPTILELQPAQQPLLLHVAGHPNTSGSPTALSASLAAAAVADSDGTVLLTTVLPPSFGGRSARYYPTKSGGGISASASLVPLGAAVSVAVSGGVGSGGHHHHDPTDFMDQWNPSPPWSEAAAKVPDIMQQQHQQQQHQNPQHQPELSPYMTTTTPPTPTSAPPPPLATAVASAAQMHPATYAAGAGAAFSFDWMPEQFVPIMDCGGTVTMAPMASAYLSHHHMHQQQPQAQQQQHSQHSQQPQAQHLQQQQQLATLHSHHQQQQQHHHQPQSQQQQLQQHHHLTLSMPTQQSLSPASASAISIDPSAIPTTSLPPMPVSMHLQMSHWASTPTSATVGTSEESYASQSHSGRPQQHEEELVGDVRDQRRSH